MLIVVQRDSFVWNTVPNLQVLFTAMPLHALRKLLAHYSVKLSSGASHEKAVTMCHLRFYKGSEAARQEAVRMFESECRRHLDTEYDALKSDDIQVVSK